MKAPAGEDIDDQSPVWEFGDPIIAEDRKAYETKTFSQRFEKVLQIYRRVVQNAWLHPMRKFGDRVRRDD